ncbi:hypothetical protein [Tautonia rosea]|uniref:hypothetical protein n=1 Tax=Tautonia rosea TaxID=2728037 RepID=UPI00147294A0|nr:hypothetical protein [Tautonia rosea]
MSHATGPRSDDGKTISSSNATTHGLTAKRPLCAEEAERLQVIVASWTAKAMPETAPEEALIASAAIEYVRYLRCVDAEESRLKPGLHQALRDWRERKQHAIRRRAQDLKHDPETVITELHESAFGIDWMLRHWRTLHTLLVSGRGWTGRDLITSLHLLGHPATSPTDPTGEPALVWSLAASAFPKAVQPATDSTGDPSAVDRLRSFVDHQIARLETLRPIVWNDVDRPEADAIEVAALVDTSKDGQLRHRYRRDAFRDFHKSLNALTRLRSERSKTFAREAKLMDASRSQHSDRPAYVPPSADRPDPPRVDSRNEPPPGPEPSPENRRNPQIPKEIRTTPSDPFSPPDRRTAPRTDERTAPDRSAPKPSTGPIDRPIDAPDRP